MKHTTYKHIMLNMQLIKTPTACISFTKIGKITTCRKKKETPTLKVKNTTHTEIHHCSKKTIA